VADQARLGWAGRAAVALVFCALAVYGIGGHALPWTVERLPLTAPLTVLLAVALLSICWATIDVLRGRRSSL
jgi:hypothetical protein